MCVTLEYCNTFRLHAGSNSIKLVRHVRFGLRQITVRFRRSKFQVCRVEYNTLVVVVRRARHAILLRDALDAVAEGSSLHI